MTDKRLLCAASLVRAGALVADIGTDHAYLPVYLVENGRCPKAIAADIGEGPAASARYHVMAAGLTHCIDVRVCDGLSGVAPDEVTDIVIAGMGGETIIHILKHAPWVKDKRYQLVLQPMTKTVELRRWLYDNGFTITKEHIVPDGRHLYSVMAVEFTGIAPSGEALLPYTGHAAPLAGELMAYVGALNIEEGWPYFCQQEAVLQKRIRGLDMAGRTDEARALLPLYEALKLFRINKKKENVMTIRDLMQTMETIAPKDLAEEWDNVGLLVGDPDTTIDTVVVALDITPKTIAFAKDVGAQVIVAHHPLIFSPVKAVAAPSALYTLAVSGIAAFAAHTNLDAANGGVNDVLAASIGLTDVCSAFGGIGRVGKLSEPLSPEAFAAMVGERLHTAVQLRAGRTSVQTVALVSGSGGDFAAETVADAFLTGEIKHHEWLDIPDSLTVVAAGHYATENGIVEPLSKRLSEALPVLKVIPFEGEAPYQTV